MTTTLTPNKQYPIQSFGSNVNSWGDVINDNLIGTIDLNLGGTLNKDVSGSSDIVLNASEARNLIQKLTGTITGNINYVVPNRGAFYLVTNNVSGAFDIMFTPFEGAGFILPSGVTILVQVDATDSLAAIATPVPTPVTTGVNTGKITKITVADSPYTVKATDFAIRADCSGGPVSIFLTGANNAWYRAKKTDASGNELLLVGTIDNTANYYIPFQNQSVDVQKDSDGWWTF